MGYAIAEELSRQGAKVILVSGPVSIQPQNQNIVKIDVESALEMYEQCINYFSNTDGAIMCAAVADYRPVNLLNEKVKRSGQNLTVELQANPDIAAELGKLKQKNQLLVGFALETNNEFFYASEKLRRKNLDFIVLNSLNDKGAGFKNDTNKITIIDKHNKTFNFELKSKQLVAVDIVDHIIGLMVL